MFLQLKIWDNADAQKCGWDDLQDTGEAERIVAEQIYMPVYDEDGIEELCAETVEGAAIEIKLGSFIHDRLNVATAEAVQAPDGTIWIEDDVYTEKVL